MKILAVDDDAMILDLLEQIIPVLGDHELITAESGALALEAIAENTDEPFDCFLFDIQMPQMDGVELLGLVREHDDYKATPIMMLTAMSDKRYIDRAFTAGATDYITKPFEVSELETRLGILKNHAVARQKQSQGILKAQNESDNAGSEAQLEIEMCDPISIYDVDNVIDHTALENYLAQLSRSSLFGSTVMAVGLREIREVYADSSAFEFYSLISDAAEVIADSMQDHQFLMSYAGNGIFVIVAEGGWYPETAKLRDSINLLFAQTELYNNRGERLNPRVEAGAPVRLIWKSGNTLTAALAEAYSNAEEAVSSHVTNKKSFWLDNRSA